MERGIPYLAGLDERSRSQAAPCRSLSLGCLDGVLFFGLDPQGHFMAWLSEASQRSRNAATGRDDS